MSRQQRRRLERERKKRFRVRENQMIETNKTFDCEVPKDYLSTDQMGIMKKIGLRNVIKVKRRKKGMTSSMEPNCCHQNVRKLVELIGGKQLVGYVVFVDGITMGLMYHSVWITPEGEVIDTTKSVDRPNDSHTYFSPVFIYKEDNVWIQGMDLEFSDDHKNSGYYLMTEEKESLDLVLMDGGLQVSKEGFLFPLKRLCWDTTLFTLKGCDESMNQFFNEGSGGFTEPSLSTGRMFS